MWLTSRNHKLLYLGLSAIFLLTTIKYGLQLFDGGHDYTTADWLIHNREGLVRRGISGSLFLGIADILHISPLIFLGLFQLSLNAFIIFTAALLFKDRELSNTELMLLLSPSFYFFWLFQSTAAMRKEILILLAFSLVLLGFKNSVKKPGLYFVATGALSMGFFFHEGMIFFLPFYMALLFIGFQETLLSRVALFTHSALAILSSLSALSFALFFSKLPETKALCEILLSYDLSKDICDGSISYLGTSSAETLNIVHAKITSDGWKAASYGLGYGLALIPLMLFSIKNVKRSWQIIGLCSGILFFAPLFIIAVDWGRWVFFYISSMSFIVIALRLFNRATVQWQAPGVVAGLFCLGWFISHSSKGLKILILEIGKLIT